MADIPLPAPVTVYRPAILDIDDVDILILLENGTRLQAEDDYPLIMERT